MLGIFKKIGPMKETERGLLLHDYVADNGSYGLSGLGDPMQLPKHCIDYIKSELTRLGIFVPRDDFIRFVAFRVFQIPDSIDPYSMYFDGMSDVEITDDWTRYKYEIKLANKKSEPINNQSEVETYKHIPNKDYEIYGVLMSNPGLHASQKATHSSMFDFIADALFDNEHIYMHNVVAGFLSNETPCGYCYVGLDDEGELSQDDIDTISEIVGRPLGVSEIVMYSGMLSGMFAKDQNAFTEPLETIRMYHVVNVISWAFLCWYLGPMGKELRSENPILSCCYETGECIVTSGGAYSANEFIKTEGHPEECVCCQVVSWCVELCHIMGKSQFVCEAHLNGQAPLFNGADCGSKVCKYVECKNHMYHNKHGSLLEMYRRSGQLGGMARPEMISYGPGPNLLAM